MKKLSFMRQRKALTTAILAALVAALVLGLAFVGCATNGGGTSAEQLPDPVAAAELAAEFNAIREGIATVNGATVTLTGRLYFQIVIRDGVADLGWDDLRHPRHGREWSDGLWIKAFSLTVPAGVTLDLTGDDVILAMGTMTLTVDGTVNSRAGGIGREDNASEVTVNGSGTINLIGKGSLFDFAGHRNVPNPKLILDGVTLVGVADNDSTLVRVGSGGELVLLSGAITGNNTTNASGNNSNGGGEIYGNSALNIDDPSGGGGIFVVGTGTFIMEGGTVYGSDAEGGKANTNNSFTSNGAICLYPEAAAKWGTGGTYTLGGVPQAGGSDIFSMGEYGAGTDATLIAIPAR